ncbi:MAG TPA: hypothetical protein QF564_01940 [Pirellulaceae bacterium]|jgi:hypothetical protein|nr:hypothetical protein [Pirellulaceae bacterium]
MNYPRLSLKPPCRHTVAKETGFAFNRASRASNAMDPTIVALFLVVALPLGWFASEFRDNRGLRILLGILAIAMSFFVAFVVGSLDRLQSNIYFSEATKDLIQNTIIELENGKSDEVIAGLRELRTDFRPTYETRDDYDILVDKYIHSISDNPIQHTGGDPRWSREIPELGPPPSMPEGEPVRI